MFIPPRFPLCDPLSSLLRHFTPVCHPFTLPASSFLISLSTLTPYLRLLPFPSPLILLLFVLHLTVTFTPLVYFFFILRVCYHLAFFSSFSLCFHAFYLHYMTATLLPLYSLSASSNLITYFNGFFFYLSLVHYSLLVTLFHFLFIKGTILSSRHP